MRGGLRDAISSWLGRMPDTIEEDNTPYKHVCLGSLGQVG